MDEIYIAAGSALISAGLTALAVNRKYQKAKTLLKVVVAAIDDNNLDTKEAKDILKAAKALIT